jgi:NADH dehydrogenase FAD-containing subunit
MDEAARKVFPAAWKAGAETQQLRDELQAMDDGGVVAMSIPLSPFRCPPGPYERISLIADYLRNNKPRSKLIVLDANAKIISKGKLFKAAWDAFYGDIIDYRVDQKVYKVDAATKTLFTDFDSVSADVANVIPPNAAHKIVDTAGLRPEGRQWVPIDPWDYHATEQADIHVIGDATDHTTVGGVPKSGFMANSMGKVAAAAVVALLQGKDTARPSMANTCYSLVSADEGISVTAVYDWNDETHKMNAVEGSSGLSPERSPLVAANAEDWAKAIWQDMLG